MHALRALTLLLSPLATAPAALAQGGVHVVDAAGGAGSDFTSLQDAMTAALDGDLILVREGVYDGATVQDKGLTIAAAEGATPRIRGKGYGYPGLTFWGIPGDSSVRLRGLQLEGAPGLHVWKADGPAFVDDCELEGDCMTGASDNAALRVTESTVIVTDSSFEGHSSCANHAAGIVVWDGEAHVFDSFLDGAGPGANALELIGESFATVSGSQLLGGDGSDAYGSGTTCVVGSDGGAGIYMLETGSGSPAVVTRDNGLRPGKAGAEAADCPGGIDGRQVEAHGEFSHETADGSSYGLDVASPTAAGTELALTLEGEPGDLAALVYATESAPAYLPEFSGALASAGSTFFIAFVGAIESEGTLTLSAPVGLPSGFDFLGLVVQGVLVGPSGITLTAPRQALIL